MKKLIKQLLVIAVMMFVGVVTTSCNKQEELETLDQNEATIPQEPLSSMDIQASAKSVVLTSVSWKEGWYDPYLSSMYTAETPKKIGTSAYAFIVTTREWKTYPVYLKLYSHSDGKVVYLELLRSGSQYEAEYKFPIVGGKYSFRVFVNNKGPWSTLYNSIHNKSYSLEVPNMVKVPPLGDDYNRNMPRDHFDFDPYQCTAWVALKINQMWGTKRAFSNKMYGTGADRLASANNWKRILTKQGYVADRKPQKGDIICWEKTNTELGSLHGHVAFVHDVVRFDIDVIGWYMYHQNSLSHFTID